MALFILRASGPAAGCKAEAARVGGRQWEGPAMRRFSKSAENQLSEPLISSSVAGIGPLAAWADRSREGPCEWIGATSSYGLSKSSTLEV